MNVTMLDIGPRQATTMIAGVGRTDDDRLTSSLGTQEAFLVNVEMPVVLRT